MSKTISFCLLLCCMPALADSPAYYPVQGFLTTDLGEAIDGPVSVNFALYDADVGGVQLWSEAQMVSVE